MGPLTLPSHGAIYLDTSAVIYSVERNEPYETCEGRCCGYIA